MKTASSARDDLILALTKYHIVAAYIQYGSVTNFYIVPEVGSNFRPALKVEIKALAKEYAYICKNRKDVIVTEITDNSQSSLARMLPRQHEVIFETKKQVIV